MPNYRIQRAGIPVPKRDVELRSSGSGPVITYRLSPEELERVRRGERLERKEEQNVATTTAPDKAEVFRRLAAGKSISKIETEMGLGKGVLHYWIDKWGLKGVKGEQAQRLLDELLIDQWAEYDPVNHPAHYTAGKVECIDAIESATTGLTGGLAYATGAAIKYLWRWSRKGGAEDLRKARWYVDRLIAEVEGLLDIEP